MPGTFYGFDVTVLSTGSGSGNDWSGIFTDCEITVDVEDEYTRAVTDITLGSEAGFDFAVQKAKSWSVRLGACLDSSATTAAVAKRQFGWSVSSLILGGVDVTSLFTRASVSIQNELANARAARDTAVSADAWKVFRMKSHKLEIEAEAVLAGAPALFDAAIADAGWNPGTALTYALTAGITGGTFTIGGNGVVLGSSVRFPAEAATQSLRFAAQGQPTSGPSWNGALPQAIMGAIGTSPLTVTISHPGGSGGTANYQGSAFVTEARFETPDGACLQNVTLQGSGALGLHA